LISTIGRAGASFPMTVTMMATSHNLERLTHFQQAGVMVFGRPEIRRVAVTEGDYERKRGPAAGVEGSGAAPKKSSRVRS